MSAQFLSLLYYFSIANKRLLQCHHSLWGVVELVGGHLPQINLVKYIAFLGALENMVLVRAGPETFPFLCGFEVRYFF
jgi:hypothetical protein